MRSAFLIVLGFCAMAMAGTVGRAEARTAAIVVTSDVEIDQDQNVIYPDADEDVIYPDDYTEV
ncbi:hypothetical protein BGZ60DRAFT_525993 [Tricladium varicosporioides]|nr:hypothetical protein BGZ60DRAFT_525993 [Hymenoscyphus varicosporioides]